MWSSDMAELGLWGRSPRPSHAEGRTASLLRPVLHPCTLRPGLLVPRAVWPLETRTCPASALNRALNRERFPAPFPSQVTPFCPFSGSRGSFPGHGPCPFPTEQVPLPGLLGPSGLSGPIP